MLENTGVLWRDPQPQDDIAGGLTRVKFEERTDGQWDPYVPQDNEEQIGLFGDTNSCTDNACSNSIDTQANYMLANNKISPANVKRLQDAGFIVDGKFNTSERDNAIMAGTNGTDDSRPKGNYLYKPWDSARNDGMIPEADMPYPNRQRVPPFTVKDYYSGQRNDAMKAKAKLFLEIFTVQYEVVSTDIDSLKTALKQAPLPIISGVCSPWAGGIIPACDKTSGHATLLYGWSGADYWKDFDSYIPTNKKLGWGYKISYAIKGVLQLNDQLESFQHLFTRPLQLNDRGDEVKALQVAMFLNGVFHDSQLSSRELIEKFGGYFGQKTMDSVKQFQAKYGLDQVGRVGPKTLAKLNSLYS